MVIRECCSFFQCRGGVSTVAEQPPTTRMVALCLVNTSQYQYKNGAKSLTFFFNKRNLAACIFVVSVSFPISLFIVFPSVMSTQMSTSATPTNKTTNSASTIAQICPSDSTAPVLTATHWTRIDARAQVFMGLLLNVLSGIVVYIHIDLSIM